MEKTYAEWMQDLKNGIQCYHEIPIAWRDEAMAMEAVQSTRWALSETPPHAKTEALCRASVVLYPSTLRHVPDEQMTEAMCLLAVRKDGLALQHVPQAFRSEAVIREALRQNGQALEFVQPEDRTKELCWSAVASNTMAMRWVPTRLKTEAFCCDVMRICPSGCSIEFMPKSVRRGQIAMQAVMKRPVLLKEIPVEYRHDELCEKAMNDGAALAYVPREQITEKMCWRAIGTTSEAFPHVPVEYRSLEMCQSVLFNNGLMLEHVPAEHRTWSTCERAVKENWRAMQFVPQAERTPELWRVAVDAAEAVGAGFEDYPQGMRGPELYGHLVERHPQRLSEIPVRARTEAICRKAVDAEPAVMAHVPKKVRDLWTAKERAHKEHVKTLLAKASPSLASGPWATLV